MSNSISIFLGAMVVLFPLFNVQQSTSLVIDSKLVSTALCIHNPDNRVLVSLPAPPLQYNPAVPAHLQPVALRLYQATIVTCSDSSNIYYIKLNKTVPLQQIEIAVDKNKDD